MISLREARHSAMVAARDRFFTALGLQAVILEGALAACGVTMEEDDDLHDLLWTSRAYATQSHPWLGAPLHRFAAAVHPSLREYAALSIRLNDTPVMWPDAQTAYLFLRAYSEYDPSSNWLTRVVLCVQHTYRAWRKAQREYRDGRPSDGVPR